MMSIPLIVTPLLPSICKPMNSLEVSRIAGFYTYHFFKKSCAPSLFVTELHNNGCADITSLNEMLTCSWDKHTHVFSSQLAPINSIRFYISCNKMVGWFGCF